MAFIANKRSGISQRLRDIFRFKIRIFIQDLSLRQTIRKQIDDKGHAN